MNTIAIEKPEVIQQLVDNIVAAVAPEKIILFGSYATGETNSDSDIDLLVIMNTELRPADRQRLISKHLYPRPAPLDIIVKTPEEIQHLFDRFDPFLREILQQGVTVYARS